jgi:hypothetical protein
MRRAVPAWIEGAIAAHSLAFSAERAKRPPSAEAKGGKSKQSKISALTEGGLYTALTPLQAVEEVLLRVGQELDDASGASLKHTANAALARTALLLALPAWAPRSHVEAHVDILLVRLRGMEGECDVGDACVSLGGLVRALHPTDEARLRNTAQALSHVLLGNGGGGSGGGGYSNVVSAAAAEPWARFGAAAGLGLLVEGLATTHEEEACQLGPARLTVLREVVTDLTRALLTTSGGVTWGNGGEACSAEVLAVADPFDHTLPTAILVAAGTRVEETPLMGVALGLAHSFATLAAARQFDCLHRILECLLSVLAVPGSGTSSVVEGMTLAVTALVARLVVQGLLDYTRLRVLLPLLEAAAIEHPGSMGVQTGVCALVRVLHKEGHALTVLSPWASTLFERCLTHAVDTTAESAVRVASVQSLGVLLGSPHSGGDEGLNAERAFALALGEAPCSVALLTRALTALRSLTADEDGKVAASAAWVLGAIAMPAPASASSNTTTQTTTAAPTATTPPPPASLVAAVLATLQDAAAPTHAVESAMACLALAPTIIPIDTRVLQQALNAGLGGAVRMAVWRLCVHQAAERPPALRLVLSYLAPDRFLALDGPEQACLLAVLPAACAAADAGSARAVVLELCPVLVTAQHLPLALKLCIYSAMHTMLAAAWRNGVAVSGTTATVTAVADAVLEVLDRRVLQHLPPGLVCEVAGRRLLAAHARCISLLPPARAAAVVAVGASAPHRGDDGTLRVFLACELCRSKNLPTTALDSCCAVVAGPQGLGWSQTTRVLNRCLATACAPMLPVTQGHWLRNLLAMARVNPSPLPALDLLACLADVWAHGIAHGDSGTSQNPPQSPPLAVLAENLGTLSLAMTEDAAEALLASVQALISTLAAATDAHDAPTLSLSRHLNAAAVCVARTRPSLARMLPSIKYS